MNTTLHKIGVGVSITSTVLGIASAIYLTERSFHKETTYSFQSNEEKKKIEENNKKIDKELKVAKIIGAASLAGIIFGLCDLYINCDYSGSSSYSDHYKTLERKTWPFIGRSPQTQISDIKELGNSRIALENNGIRTLNDLVNVIRKNGDTNYLSNLAGIGDKNQQVIDNFVWNNTTVYFTDNYCK